MWIPERLLSLALLAMWAGSGFAWEVTNRLVIEHGALVIDHSKSVSEISQAQAKGGFPAGHGVGLFQNRFTTELVFEPPASGAAVRRLSMTTRIKTAPIIYVAREFPRDSCAYAAVLGHERLHQLFDLDVLRFMSAEIHGITQDVFPVDELERAGTRNLDRARGHFLRQFKYVYDGLSNLRHLTIDNPESYAHLGTLCSGEIARRLTGAQP